ncbi:MAG: hypothetical protein JSU85_15240 [Candidatus Zixiibacteriota bacterium]|nr:MAG: hypothetical protein JSU85_15240 [candidate division Zixibacteria bacterium]
MKRVVFMDLDMLDGLENRLPPEPDPELVSKVDEALKRLGPASRDVLVMRFYDGISAGEIADRLGRPEKDIISIIYEAKRRMKIDLAEFVSKRWGIDVGNLCKICAHSERPTIENILKSKSPDESWKKITERVYRRTGERFHPPQLLKAHLKHMPQVKDRQDG